MRVALVHDWLTGMRGGEKCLEVLCRQFPDARLFTLLHRPGAASPAIERMRITTSFLQHIPGIQRFYRHFLPLMPRAVESLPIPGDVDLVVSFSHAVAKGIRPPAGVPHVCYCFTPMRYAWQLRADYFGDRERGPAPGGAIWRRPVTRMRDALLDRVRRWDHQVANRVTHYVAISRTIADRIRACYGRESTIIYPPVDTDFYTPSTTPRDDFYLCVSALAPYKRLDLAIAACERLGRRLLIIGRGPEERRLRKLAGRWTTFLGWQSDEAIRDRLRTCRAFLFPGLEDFGIAPVEAQACGTPVIAYGQGGAAETIVDQRTGLLFPQQSVNSLCGAIEQFEACSPALDSRACRANALRFHAARYENELLALLEETIAARGGRLAKRRREFADQPLAHA